MVNFAQAVQNTSRLSLTANGMATFESSSDPSVDLFFAIGSSRGKDLSQAFARSYASDPDISMKILFWARDVRGGAGERDTFRKLICNLEVTQIKSLEANLSLIPLYGRWDDLLVFQTPRMKVLAYDLINRALRAGNGLTAKWMPRKGTVANDLRKYMNFTPKAYRQLLVSLTNVVETQMCAKNWDAINYSHVPSIAAARYQKAFNKRDTARYASWKEGLKTGETKVNASALYPYDVLKSIEYGDRDVAAAQWEALPNYLGDDKILPMIDVSGSMNCSVGTSTGQKGVGINCMDMSVSLGLYIADKQTGAFKDCFLTFDTNSRLEVLKGNLLQKIAQLRSADWGGSTNLDSGFQEILRVATTNNLPASEMPKYLVVLSDMEFNPYSSGMRNIGAFELATNMFASAGYELPNIVWWNLNARPDAQGNSPVRFDQTGAALISGYSPSIMKSVLTATSFTPRDIMMETIGGDRYQVVTSRPTIPRRAAQ